MSILAPDGRGDTAPTPIVAFDNRSGGDVAKYDAQTTCGMLLCRQRPTILFHAVRPCEHEPKRMDIGLCPRHEYAYHSGFDCHECNAVAAVSEPVSVRGAASDGRTQ